MRITGSYDSLIRGVSEQVPHDRLAGQFWAQDNMISDPVRGLARRHGSRKLHEVAYPTVALSEATRQDAAAFKAQAFSIDAVDYSLAYRTEDRPAGSTMVPLVLSNLQTGQLVPVSVAAADTLANTVLTTGVSSITSLGRYVLLASRTQATTYTTVDKVAENNTRSVVWIKGGAYSRTYRVRVYNPAGGLVANIAHTTPSSYYQGTLDTSDIPTSDPDYQKLVNDRIHAYNTAVNQYIGTASAAIQPQNIAEALRLLLTPSTTVTREGSHLQFTGVGYVEVDDGGDGQYMKAVSQEVTNVSDLTERHWVGKTIKVVPRSGTASASSFYLHAEGKRPGATGFSEVTWVEGPGVLTTPQFMFLMGTVEGGVFHVASSPTALGTVTGIPDVPDFLPSTSGDLESQPLWQFLGGTISYLRSFQDRLVIVTGATVFMSKSGDYFNFFRSSALTLANDDPLEIFAEGSEGDLVSAGVAIDRNLLLFGRHQQYAIPGREGMVPQNAFIAVQSAHADAVDAPPVTGGNLVFFTQKRDTRLTLQQLQTGAYADSFDAFDISPQLDGYMRGTPQQIVAMASPAAVFIRTREFTNGVYVYSYLDAVAEQSRLFDSWSRWTWDEALGTLFSIAERNSTLYTLTLRDSSDGTYIVLDAMSRAAQLSEYPYLDSWRPYSEVETGTIRQDSPFVDRCAVALTAAAGPYQLLGRDLDEADILFQGLPGQEEHAVIGFYTHASIEPTSPYKRDRQDRAILDCRMTLTKLIVSVSHSAALRAAIRGMDDPEEDETQIVSWVQRPVGQWVVNTQQIATAASVTIPIMREIREHRVRIYTRSWLPLTISSVEWSAQYFTTRSRR